MYDDNAEIDAITYLKHALVKGGLNERNTSKKGKQS